MKLRGLTLLSGLVALPAALPALAQDQGGGNFFAPPADDPSLGVLREIFGNIVDFAAGHANAADLANNGTVIAAGFAVFCTAVLTLGLIFVAYTTFIGVINTANDGSFLGRKMSNVWVPLRTAAGSALLLPLAGGFCFLQIIVMWLAVQGVGMADRAWTAMLVQIDDAGMISHPHIPDARPLVANIFLSEVCMAAMNKSYADSGRAIRVDLKTYPKTLSMMVPTDDLAGSGLGGLGMFGFNYKRVNVQTTTYSWETNDGYTRNDVCGKIEWEESAASEQGNARWINTSQVYQAHGAAVNRVIVEMRAIAQQIVAGQKPSPGPIARAAYQYENDLRQLARASIEDVGNGPRNAFVEFAKRGGWIQAGTYNNHMIALQDAVQLAVNSFPTSSSIDIDQRETEAALTGYRDAMAVANEYLLARADAAHQAYEQERGGMGACSPVPTTWEGVRKCLSEPALFAIEQITMQLAGSNTSHLTQVKSIGDTVMTAAWTIAGINALTSGVAGSLGGEVVSQGVTAGFFSASSFLQSLSFLISFLVITMLASGAAMSFYIPLIPFIAWMAGVIKWIGSIVEAMMAAPIWAAAHIHPDGDDAVGRAGPGYMIIISMVTRPILMLFGLICSIAVAQPLAHLINGGYMMAVSGAMHDSANGIGALVAYSVIYVIIMTTLLHAVFSLINWVPDTVYRFMGSAVGMHGIADTEDRDSHHVFGAAARHSGGVMQAKRGGDSLEKPSGGGGSGGGGGNPPGGGGGTTSQADHSQVPRSPSQS